MLELSDEEYSRFHRSLKFTIAKETMGGKVVLVNDPDDPGGVTKWGISQRFNPDVDVRNLTADQAAEIYYTRYWLTTGCDDLPWPLCLSVFDSAVIPGPSRAIGFLKAADRDAIVVQQLRKEWFRRNSNPKYINGWLNRCNDLIKLLEMEKAA